MDNTLMEMMRKRDEIKKRLEEKQRLFDLIENPRTHNPVKTQDLLKKNSAAKCIQKFLRKYKRNFAYEYKITNSEINHITFIQNAYRKHLVRKSREYYKHYTKDKIANQFIEDLKNDKVTKLRNQIYNNSLTRERPDLSIPSQLKYRSEYFVKYKKYNENFPNLLEKRNDTHSRYLQCEDFMKYLEKNKELGSLTPFNSLILNNNKKEKIMVEFNNIIDSINNKMWWYKYSDVNDYETKNLVHEIDNHFGFSNYSEIFNPDIIFKK